MGERRMHPEPHRFPEEQTTQMLLIESAVIFLLGLFVFYVAAAYDLLERLYVIARKFEGWEIDEFIIVALFLVVALATFSLRRWLAFRKVNAVLVQRNIDLDQAMDQLKELSGIIPICSACKKIRDDEGFWHQVESYIETHSHAEFTHGICPECTKMLYPEYFAHKTNGHE
jgi:hypothetical protein